MYTWCKGNKWVTYFNIHEIANFGRMKIFRVEHTAALEWHAIDLIIDILACSIEIYKMI